MSDWGLRDRWDLPGRKALLVRDFTGVAAWARTAGDSFDPVILQRVADAAVALQGIVQLADPSVALKYMDGGRGDLQFIANLEPLLHQRPEGDPHRCNPALRTAIRRANQYLTEMGATFQYC